MTWDYPVITTIRKFIRSLTPGELPPMSNAHPFVGLIHDVQRLIRRRLFGGRGYGESL